MDDLYESNVIRCFVCVWFQPLRGEEDILNTKQAALTIPSNPNSYIDSSNH